MTRSVGRLWSGAVLPRDLEQFVGKDSVHMRSRSDAALDVAFGLKLLECIDDGSAREPILPRQIARGREARSRVQPTFEDLRTQGVIEPMSDGLPHIPFRERQLERNRSFHNQNGTS